MFLRGCQTSGHPYRTGTCWCEPWATHSLNNADQERILRHSDDVIILHFNPPPSSLRPPHQKGIFILVFILLPYICIRINEIIELVKCLSKIQKNAYENINYVSKLNIRPKCESVLPSLLLVLPSCHTCSIVLYCHVFWTCN